MRDATGALQLAGLEMLYARQDVLLHTIINEVWLTGFFLGDPFR